MSLFRALSLALAVAVGANEAQRTAHAEDFKWLGARQGGRVEHESGHAPARGVFMGINCFAAGDELALKYAAADAIALCHLMVIEKQWLLPQNVRLFVDQAAGSGRQPCAGSIPLTPATSACLAALAEAGVRVEVPNKNNLINALDEAFSRDNPVVLALSTHGLEDASSVYLMPPDFNRNFPQNTGITLTEILDQFARAPEAPKLVLFDACREAGGEAPGGRFEELLKGSFQDFGTKNATVLASCAPGELSREFPRGEHGLFTYFLLDGMRMQDATREEDIRQQALSAFAYASSQVKWWSYWLSYESSLEGGKALGAFRESREAVARIYEQIPTMVPVAELPDPARRDGRTYTWPGRGAEAELDRQWTHLQEQLRSISTALTGISPIHWAYARSQVRPLKYVHWGLEALRHWRDKDLEPLQERFRELGGQLLGLPFRRAEAWDEPRFDQDLNAFWKWVDEQEVLRGLADLAPRIEFNLRLNTYKVRNLSTLPGDEARDVAGALRERLAHLLPETDRQAPAIAEWLHAIERIPFDHEVARSLQQSPRETEDSLVYTYRGGTIEFRRINPRDESLAPFYLATTELPVGLALEWINRETEKEFQEQFYANDGNRAGVVTWEARNARGKVAREWILSANYGPAGPNFPPDPVTNRPRFDQAPGPPTGRVPLNQVRPDDARQLARSMGFRLPTAREWASALEYWRENGGEPENLRDESWRLQRDYVAQRAGQARVPRPDDGVFLPRANAASDEIARAANDGVLWFAPVDGARHGGLAHLEGNVAEYLFEDGQYYVAGASALSPPEVEPGKAIPLRRSQEKRFADVGLRLCMDLLPGEKLHWLVHERAYLKPSE